MLIMNGYDQGPGPGEDFDAWQTLCSMLTHHVQVF